MDFSEASFDGDLTGLEPGLRSGGGLLSRAERAAAGRAARQRARRSSHGTWSPSSNRRSSLAILNEQNRRRYPDLVPIRWGRMVASPFTYYRGAAAVMASDLAGTPDSGLVVQACGDAHCQNFGLFASPERRLLFDLNDFDETLPGPWEWDVKRLAASMVLAARDRGFTTAEATSAALASVASYREWMLAFAQMSQLDVWYSKVDIDELFALLPDSIHRAGQKVIDKARRRTTLQALERLTEVVDGRRRIIDEPPIVEHLPDTTTVHAVHTVLDRYRETLSEDRRVLLERFEIIDVARKVVGVGSVGTHCWISLMSADSTDDDPLFLQIKEANRSVLEPWIAPARHHNHGERVVVGQRLMQAASDLFLGWTSFRDRHFYVRQLRDMKGSIDISNVSATALVRYGGFCGTTLARAHARTGDPVAIAAYLGNGDGFDRAIASFSHSYADQTEIDHAELREAIDSGRIEAVEGV